MDGFEKKLTEVFELNEMTKGLVTEEKAKTLHKMVDIMKSVNEHMNITAIKDDEGIILKHLCDSACPVPFIPENAKICDIGCGGGFPTFPVSILRDDVSVLAVDSVTKKVEYVKNTASELGLKNISVSNQRAEVLGQNVEYRERFDTVTARAVGRLNVLCELCIPLVKVGGLFVAMKSQSGEKETAEAQKAITVLGGRLEREIKYSLTDGNETIERELILIRKVGKTDRKYPRNNSQIAKKMLI